MPNQFIQQYGDTPDAQAIALRQKMASQLLAQGQQPIDGQMVSGIYVAPSITQNLARGLQMYLGKRDLDSANQDQKALYDSQQQKSQQELSNVADLLRGRKAITLPNDQAGPVSPAQPPDVGAALAAMTSSKNPALQQAGFGAQFEQAMNQSRMADEQARANEFRNRQGQLWQQSGGDLSKFMLAGGDEKFGEGLAKAPMAGKEELINVNGQLVGKMSGNAVGDVIPKQEPQPNNIQEYEYAKKQGYSGTLQQFILDQRKAGASNVSVNTGQRGFENSLKLRNDFRMEPIYKSHQDMQSAYSLIGASLKQGTPIGDYAAATKIMKLLDSNSTVRESELGMAIKASGLLDRITSFAGNVINGTKLTTEQRKQFQALADEFYGESVKLYNSKRNEYKDIAYRNQLNIDDVVGPEYKLPTHQINDDLASKAQEEINRRMQAKGVGLSQ